MKKPRTIADVNRDQGREMEKALGPIRSVKFETVYTGPTAKSVTVEFLEQRLAMFKKELHMDDELQYDADFERLRIAYRLVIDDIQGD